MDAIELLKQDHQAVEGLFERFISSAGRDDTARGRVVDSIIQELTVHAQMEEQVFYPAVRNILAQGDELVTESLEEHQEVKGILAELEQMSPGDQGFDSKVMNLIGDVRHHVNEEEGEILPKLQTAIGVSQLADLGQRMEEFKLSLTGGTAKKSTARKSTAKKSTAKKSTARKSTAKKSTARGRAASGPGRKVYHVAPGAGGGWEVALEGAKRASSTHDRKGDAVARGRELAQRGRLGQLIVHKQDGRIHQEFTYGADPRRSKG